MLLIPSEDTTAVEEVAEVRQTRIVEDIGNLHRRAELTGQAVDDLDGLQRLPAQLEEVVARLNRADAENLLPDSAHPLLSLIVQRLIT